MQVSFYCISLVLIKSVLIKPVLIKSFEMKRPFMIWINFISICCSKVVKEGKSCPSLGCWYYKELLKTPKSCRAQSIYAYSVVSSVVLDLQTRKVNRLAISSESFAVFPLEIHWVGTLSCLWNSKLRYPPPPPHAFGIPVQETSPLPRNSKMPPMVWYGYFLESPNAMIIHINKQTSTGGKLYGQW